MAGEYETISGGSMALTFQATPASLMNGIAAALILMEMSESTYLRSPTLTNLPNEILLCIMEEIDSPIDLMSLILTARLFNDIWKRRTHSISAAVLTNSMGCFPNAKRLEETVHPERPVDFHAVVARQKRMLRAAQYISYMYELFKSNYLTAPFRKRNQDRKWFHTSFYFLWQHVVTASYKPFRFLPPSRLDDPFPLPPIHSIFTLCELIVWIRNVRGHAAASDRIFRRANRIYRHCHENNIYDHNIIIDARNNNHIYDDDIRNTTTTTITRKKQMSQSKRWSDCCLAVWYHPWFEAVRKDYWINDLRLHTPEPGGSYPGDPYFHARPRLLGFLVWARQVRVWRMEAERRLRARR